jgi:membrane-bound lytic murein transglycosylase D
MTRIIQLALLCLVYLSVAACNTQQVAEPAVAAIAQTTADKTETTLPTPSVVEEIYADMEGAVAAYHEAMGLIESGSMDAGEALLEDALAGLDDSVNRCRAIAGCDLNTAVTAYQDIMDAQSRVFDDSSGIIEALMASPGDPLTDSSNAEKPPAAGNYLNGRDLVELIPMNRQVQEALNDWLTWNRPLLMRSYENYQYLRSEMVPAYEDAGFPEALLFGMLTVESAGKVHAYSRAGAAGPLQFMRGTGRIYGLNTSNGFDQRMDPEMAAGANVAYLQNHLRQLGNSLEKTLAAYNAGENRLKRLDRELRGADFWSSEFFFRLPRDTRKYVPEVLAAAYLYLHADEYNLRLPIYETDRTVLQLSQDASLGELAICLGNADQSNGWFRTLRNLNPAVKPGDRITAGEQINVPARVAALYQAQCVDNELASKAMALHNAAYNEKENLLPYVIQNGDTLGRIARRYRCMSIRELAALNNIKPPRYFIRAGKTIKVPNC